MNFRGEKKLGEMPFFIITDPESFKWLMGAQLFPLLKSRFPIKSAFAASTCRNLLKQDQNSRWSLSHQYYPRLNR